MKSRILMCITVMTLFAALANRVPLYAQGDMASAKSHTIHYKLIDMGTLGGPQSFGSINGEGNLILNDSGMISAFADTPSTDPYAPLCFEDCFLAHAFRWQDGTMTDLGALLPGVNNSAAGAINARGWSVGQSQNGLLLPLTGIPEIQAVLWRDDQIVNLGTLGGNGSLAGYVNNGGQVVGAAANAVSDPFSLFGNIFGETQTRAFLWEKGVMRDLGTLGGPDAVTSGGCVNERIGLVAGSSYTNSIPNLSTGLPTLDPFLWENGKMTDLGTLGGVYGTAQCANDRGQVIGQSSLAEFPGACVTQGPGCHAFIWEHGALADLGTLGGTFSIPLWLNNAGEAVGGATTTGDQLHATVWRQGQITDLGTLPGDCSSVADAINAKGQIVGSSVNCDTGTSRAVLWDKGSIFDLNALIPSNANLQLQSGTNINTRGEILGLGAFPNFAVHDVLLVPCHTNQADQADCDSGESTTSTRQNASPHTTSTSLPNQAHLTPSEVLAAWRVRWAQRYRIPGTRTPKD